MIAAFLELDRGLAVVALLPSFFSGELDEFFCGLVLGTLARPVPFVIAETADLCLAPFTNTVFAPVSGSMACIDAYVGRFDPLATTFGRTVNPVLGCEFLELSIPFDFELHVKKSVDIVQGNAFSLAAFRRHMLRIGD